MAFRAFQHRFLAAIVVAILSSQASVRADVIDFSNIKQLPDMTVGGLSVNYNAASGLFRAGSFTSATSATTLKNVAMSIKLDEVGTTSDMRLNASYLINIPVDSSGVPTGTGTLTIYGTKALFDNNGVLIPGSNTAPATTLLSAELAAFGFGDPGTKQFSFVWKNTGGALVTEGYFGQHIGTTLVVGTWVAPGFQDFSTSFVGTNVTNNTHNIPTPGALPIGMILFGLIGCRRRRRIVDI